MRADEHPEELIDRVRRGSLAPEAQATLQPHLEGCAVCALQISLAPQFEREVAPQLRDWLLAERAVEVALRRMQRSPRVGRVRRFPRRSRWAAAALLVFGVTVAAAIIRRTAPPRVIRSPVPVVASPTAVAPIHPAVPPPAMPAAPSPKPAPAAHGAAHATVTAEALFERAESLRREGRADAAVATYRWLQANFPETAEAQLSFVLAGKLLLERGRPGDALAQFDRHSSAAGDVSEELLAGQATALEQLHRPSEAIAAWKRLLARYPQTVYAERARARLDELTQHR